VPRGHKVLLDAELAALYGVTTKRLNEQVRRNRERFPTDFMFQLTAQEAAALRSQFATLQTVRLHRARRHHGRIHPE
jgi:ORF6N domain